jgi:hypothetical protein
MSDHHLLNKKKKKKPLTLHMEQGDKSITAYQNLESLTRIQTASTRPVAFTP